MTKTKEDLVIETAIAEMTDQYKRQIIVRTSGKHGSGMKIVLEGHDISHLVTSYDMTATPHDAIRVRLELIGLEFEPE